MEAFTWIVAIVGGIGLGGVIAAAIAFPLVVVPVLQKIGTWFISCKPCLIALAIGAAAFSGWWSGHYAETQECKADQLAAELRNREVDLAIANQSRSDETERANRIAQEAEQRQKDDADYIATLQGRPACLFDDDDVGVRAPSGRAGEAKPATAPR